MRPLRRAATTRPSGSDTLPADMAGVRLEELTWLEAQRELTPDRVVVLPLGAAAKEHGPHLKLGNDAQLAQYFAARVLEAADVVMAPIIPYHYYPAFVEYPGSTTLRLETARDLVIDICQGLARFGPRRFYVLNTGVSTVRALAPAVQALAAGGVLLGYTDLLDALGPIEREVAQQEGGTHADEIETSMMLHIAPESVDMSRAVKDYDPCGNGPLTRIRGATGTYSPTGIFGDPTLATAEKGRRVAEALVKALLCDIERLRTAPLPLSRPGLP
ncbi:MAG: creatininase family protein [Candidatus Wallbacteria bacterium]|nr:creatininase family protein [Candidatus Wallbacteria bacterium]